MNHRRFAAAAAFLGLGLAPLAAQFDTNTLQAECQRAVAAVSPALVAAEQAVAAVRAALVDPSNKLQGNCEDIANALKGESFDAALGTIPIARGFVGDYVPTERHTAVQAALDRLDDALRTGSRAVQQRDALQELATRWEHLQSLGADDDASSPLADLAATTGRVARSGALPALVFAALQQQLGKRRLGESARMVREQMPSLTAEAEPLQQASAELLALLRHDEPGERARGLERCSDALRSLQANAARLPHSERLRLLQPLQPLLDAAQVAHRQQAAGAVAQRLQESWLFTVDEFTGWEQEQPTITGEGYLLFEPPTADTLGQPKSVALVNRVDLWCVFADTDAEAQRVAGAAEMVAVRQPIEALRTAAQTKLLAAARTVVDGLAPADLGDETLRGRLVTLADWDLPHALHNHVEQAALVAGVHARLDAHDERALGAERALAVRREQAMAAAENLWPRYLQWLAAEGGFAPATPALFTGRSMLLTEVWPRTAEFVAGEHDVVFDLDGHLFAGHCVARLRAELQAQRQRLALPTTERFDPASACALVVVIGGPAEVRLRGPGGDADAMVLPATRVEIIAARQGALFAAPGQKPPTR